MNRARLNIAALCCAVTSTLACAPPESTTISDGDVVVDCGDFGETSSSSSESTSSATKTLTFTQQSNELDPLPEQCAAPVDLKGGIWGSIDATHALALRCVSFPDPTVVTGFSYVASERGECGQVPHLAVWLVGSSVGPLPKRPSIGTKLIDPTPLNWKDETAIVEVTIAPAFIAESSRFCFGAILTEEADELSCVEACDFGQDVAITVMGDVSDGKATPCPDGCSFVGLPQWPTEDIAIGAGFAASNLNARVFGFPLAEE